MVNYDSKTEHGIPYLATLYHANFEYQTVVDDLDGLVTVRKQVISGSGSVTSYSLGSRSVTRQTLTGTEVLNLWDRLMAKKTQLETGARPRKAAGIVLRDW